MLLSAQCKKDLKLRKLLDLYTDTERYVECADLLEFELNHLEIHNLDNYLFNLADKGVSGLDNKNSSSVAYVLGLTDVKPIGKIKTKGGTSPDIDSDVQHNRREEVFKYLREKYQDGFSHIGTFAVSQGRGLFKDICRIMEVPFATSNQLAKLIPESASYKSVDDSLKESSELKQLYDSDPQIKEIVDMAREMEGCVKSLGIHAAGVILSDEPVSDYVPQFSSKDAPVTQFDAHVVEDVGFLKIDVLSLKTLSVIQQTFDYIKQTKGIEMRMQDISLDDVQTYKIFPARNTLGIFQLEATGITEFAARCNPKNIYDISNVIAIYRPGPLNIPGLVPNYIKACNGIESFDFPFPEYNYIFDKTYNFLVYQEQLSRLSMDMCGFSGPKSDELRRATAKKDREALLKLKDDFVDGAVEKGHEKSKVEKLFDEMEEFSRYSFNLSHSISYAHLTYFTAYLKTHYPSEFFAACISLEDDPEQKSKYIDDARFNGLSVLPPDVNLSTNGFTIANNGSILFGFNGIKGLGPAVIKKIIESRPFTSFTDFLAKAAVVKGINKKSIEALIHTGSLDSFGISHSCMEQSFEKFLLDLTDNGKIKELDPARVAEFLKKEDEYFDSKIQEYSIFNILQKEKELMGIYISGNPFDIIASLIDEEFYSVKQLENRLEITPPGVKVREYMLCEIVKVKKHQLKTGSLMGFVDCKDHEGTAFSLTLFTEAWKEYGDICTEGNYLLCYCDISTGSRGFSVVANSCIDLSQKIQRSNIGLAKKLKRIGVHIIGIPSTPRIKTIQGKIEQYQDPDGKSMLDLYLDIDNFVFLVKSFPIKVVDDIEIIRDINKIPDIYVTRIDTK